MSEDEGTNTTAQGVPSEDQPADGEIADETEARSTDESDAEPVSAADEADESGASSADSTTAPASDSADDQVSSPETSEDIAQLVSDVREYDDDLAQQVTAVVDEARELNGTVTDQRAELEDLSERVDEQAETISTLQSELETREGTLEEYEEELEDLKERLKRKQADFQNYKKRAKKRQEQMKERATEDLVERLVGVRDNLKRALEEESGDIESLRDGVEMTMREFDRILEDENVAEVDPDPGTETDPQRHEVMMQVDSAQPEGTVADVYTPGYEMGEKVIQTAQVTVSNGELEGEASDADADETTDEGHSETAAESTEGAEETVDDSDDAGGDSEPTTDSSGGDDATTDTDDADAIELGGEVESDEDADETGS